MKIDNVVAEYERWIACVSRNRDVFSQIDDTSVCLHIADSFVIKHYLFEILLSNWIHKLVIYVKSDP